MNFSSILAATVASVLAGGTASAGPRASASHTISTDSLDTGGAPSSSGLYTNDGSAGTVAGVGTLTSPTGIAKHGYIGQLYEIVGFALNDSPSSVPESFSLQLVPGHLLDDATLLAIAPALVNWSVVSGPITSISPGGLATAGLVYQDTSSTVQGSFGASTATLDLTVLNTNDDDLAGYAGDGISDDWQVQYFGLPPNQAAGPLLDPDGDGQNNRFEWIAGLIPTDANSVFRLRILLSFEGANLIFGPTVAGRAYAVKYGFDFLEVPNWPPLAGGIVTDLGSQRTVTDPHAPGSPTKFYRVEIQK